MKRCIRLKEELKKWHNTVLDIHEKSLFNSVIRDEHINSVRKMQKFTDMNGNKTKPIEGFMAQKGGQKYFIEPHIADSMPIKVDHEAVTKLIDDQQNLVYKPTKVKSFKITAGKVFEPQEFLNDFMPLDHSNCEVYDAFKLFCIACEIGKIGACISTEKGFGKSNIYKSIGHVTNLTHVVPVGTYKGMLGRVNGKGSLVIDEIINVGSEKKKDLQKIILNMLGSDDNIKNEALKTGGTKDEYDIKEQSFIMLYNLIEDLGGDSSNFFDNIVKNHPAIMDRVLKLRFTGMISTVWHKNFNMRETAEQNRTYYINVAKYMQYLRELLRSGEYQYRYSYNWTYGLSSRKAQMLMDIKFVMDFFSTNQEDFSRRMKVIEDAMRNYDEAMEVHSMF